MSKELSGNDKKVYSLIRNRKLQGLDSPTLKEINEILGKTSPRSAVLSLLRLEKSGLIKRLPGNEIQLSNEVNSVSTSIDTVLVPLVGEVAAGMPILAEENIQATIQVSTAFARPGSRYFLLRIVGDSMNLAEVNRTTISDRSIVLVRQQSFANDGDIVVALINDEATVKIFNPIKGAIILRPKSSNSIHKPIILTENCLIQGIVIAVLPNDIY